MSTIVTKNLNTGKHTVTISLEPDQAEALADALGPSDSAHDELYEAAARARQADKDEEDD